MFVPCKFNVMLFFLIFIHVFGKKVIFFSLPHFSHMVPVLSIAEKYMSMFPDDEVVFGCSEKYRKYAEEKNIPFYSMFNSISIEETVRKHYGVSSCHIVDIWNEVSSQAAPEIERMHRELQGNTWVFDFLAFPSTTFAKENSINFVKVEITAFHSGFFVVGVGDLFCKYLSKDLLNSLPLGIWEAVGKPLLMLRSCGFGLFEFAQFDTDPTVVMSYIGFEFNKRKYYPGFLKRVGFLPLNRSNEMEKLSEKVQDFLDMSEKSKVVYVSPGSMFLFDEKYANILLESLTELGYNVVYSMRDSARTKYSDEFFKRWDGGGDSRVLFSSWLNQWMLLQHEKIAFFVSHSGGSSLMESLYHNVPIFAIPQYGDQFGLSARVVEREMGVRILFEKEKDIKEEKKNLLVKLEEMKDNLEKFRRNMKIHKELSELKGGAESAANFVREISNFGTDHLQPVGFDVESNFLLIFVTFVLVILIVGNVSYCVYHLLCGNCFGGSKENLNVAKKNL